MIENIFDNSLDTNSLELNSMISNLNNTPDIYWKIIEFEINDKKFQIKTDYSIGRNIYYLGKINEDMLIFFNKEIKNINIFNFVSFSIVYELPFKSNLKPLISFPLTKRNDIIDLFFLCEEGYLVQYVLNIKKKILYLISKIKIDLQNIPKYPDLIAQSQENIQNYIVKMIRLQKTNYLLITNQNLIYNLKK